MGPTNTHFWLLQRMAKTTGVDLVTAYDRDILAPQEWADLVTRCRTCQWAEGCGRFLSEQALTERPLPDNCVNGKALNTIKKALEEAAQ
ncbi:MAG: DUF6455 family protein [Pelagimonas sp.]|jgi:hypothetical protein|nr:DUF6455 family protein [Pelagimonas sp.]